MAITRRREQRAERAERDGGGGATGVTATARRGVGGGFFLVARLVMLVATVLAGIIIAAILLRVFGANTSNSIVKGIHDLAKTLVGPAKDLFTIKNAKVAIAVNWGIAAAVYLMVGSIIARILRRIGVTSHPDRV